MMLLLQPWPPRLSWWGAGHAVDGADGEGTAITWSSAVLRVSKHWHLRLHQLLPPVYSLHQLMLLETTPRPAAPPQEQPPSLQPGHTSTSGRLPWAIPARPLLPLFVLLHAGGLQVARASPP